MKYKLFCESCALRGSHKTTVIYTGAKRYKSRLMLTLTRRLPADASILVPLTLALTADDRTRSRHYFETNDRQPLYLNLPRGTVLQHGDLLQGEADEPLVRIIAKPEPVMTAIAHTPLELLRAAYHLGNRHVPLEVTEHYLRFSADSVLKAMLEQLGLHIHEDIAPFQPETGAYGHSHAHSHNHPHHRNAT